MTYEQAAYFRLLLLLGYPEPLDSFFDAALEDEEPLSEVILALVDCGGNRKAQMVALYEYTQRETQVDYTAVGRYVLDFAREKKTAGWSLDQTVHFLYCAYKAAEREDEPWWSMMVCDAWYDDAKWNWCSKEDFLECFERFLCDGEKLSVPQRTVPKQESFWQKLRKLWKR